MSDDIEKLKSENMQLNNLVSSFSGQLRAIKAISDDFYLSIVNLRTSNFLLDDQFKQGQSLLNEANNKIKSLEEANKELNNRIESLLP